MWDRGQLPFQSGVVRRLILFAFVFGLGVTQLLQIDLNIPSTFWVCSSNVGEKFRARGLGKLWGKKRHKTQSWPLKAGVWLC